MCNIHLTGHCMTSDLVHDMKLHAIVFKIDRPIEVMPKSKFQNSIIRQRNAHHPNEMLWRADFTNKRIFSSYFALASASNWKKWRKIAATAFLLLFFSFAIWCLRHANKSDGAMGTTMTLASHRQHKMKCRTHLEKLFLMISHHALGARATSRHAFNFMQISDFYPS